MPMNIAVLGDIHFPFHSEEALNWALDIIKRGNFSHVIQCGDLVDFYSLSRFSKSQNSIRMTPLEEIESARDLSVKMWENIKKVSPRSKCIQLTGNHDIRLKSSILNSLPELLGLVDLSYLFKFKGVKTIHSDKEEFVLNDICFMHGYRSKLGDHCKHNLMCTVCGHSHRGGVFHMKLQNEMPLWELNVGFLADQKSAALSYQKQRWVPWTLGMGIVDDLGPRFVPFPGIKK